MLVGEALGVRRIRQGLTWRGATGPTLREALREGTGREPEDAFYLTNVLSCCPPRNRDPTRAEAYRGSAFLTREIAALVPARVV